MGGMHIVDAIQSKLDCARGLLLHAGALTIALTFIQSGVTVSLSQVGVTGIKQLTWDR